MQVAFSWAGPTLKMVLLSGQWVYIVPTGILMQSVGESRSLNENQKYPCASRYGSVASLVFSCSVVAALSQSDRFARKRHLQSAATLLDSDAFYAFLPRPDETVEVNVTELRLEMLEGEYDDSLDVPAARVNWLPALRQP